MADGRPGGSTATPPVSHVWRLVGKEKREIRKERDWKLKGEPKGKVGCLNQNQPSQIWKLFDFLVFALPVT